MVSNEKYRKFVIPELVQFWKNHKQDYLNSGLTDGLFLPYVYPGYDACQKKIFYIGQDAPYWEPVSRMADNFDVGNIREYIWWNNHVMQKVEDRLGWGNHTSFWTMIVKTHLYILTNKWYDDINKISITDKVLLDTMGYGNVHFIPRTQTINRYPGHNINKAFYDIVDNALKRFNYLQPIVDNFEPDTIVILGTAFNKKRYFNGLNIQWLNLPNYVPSNLISVGDILGTQKTVRLIWVYNPSYYSFAGTNMQDVADLIKLYA